MKEQRTKRYEVILMREEQRTKNKDE